MPVKEHAGLRGYVESIGVAIKPYGPESTAKCLAAGCDSPKAKGAYWPFCGGVFERHVNPVLMAD